MARLHRDECSLYFEDTGGDAPAVLFLHGTGGNHLSWWQQVPAFATRYRCVTIDLRGFGQSPDHPDGPGPHAFGQDVIDLLDHLNVGRVALVGQSMGGWAAVSAVVRQPARFWACVLTNTVGNLSSGSTRELRRRLAAGQPPIGRVEESGLGARFRAVNAERTFLYAEINALNPARDSGYIERLKSIETPVEAYVAAAVRTLLVIGEDDRLIWPEMSAAVHHEIPGSELRCVPGAGHSVHFEAPEVFNQIVLGFFDRVLGSP